MTNQKTLGNPALSLAPPPRGPDPSSRAGWRWAQTQRLMLRALAGRQLTHEAKVAFSWWPTLQYAAVSLCAHVGEAITTEDGTPLAHEIVFKAVEAFSKATHESGGRVDDGVHAFLRTILEAADDLLHISVYVVDHHGKRTSWRKFNQSFHDWTADNADLPVQIAEEPVVFGDERWAARRMLATLTMTPGDFRRCCSEEPLL